MTGHVIVLEREIKASPERIWDVLTNVERAGMVLTSVAGVEMMTKGPYDVGTRWQEERTRFGNKAVESYEVIEADAPRHTVVQATVGHDKVRTSWALTPHTESTHLVMTMVSDTSERSLGGKISHALFGQGDLASTRAMLNHDLDEIAAAAESAD